MNRKTQFHFPFLRFFRVENLLGLLRQHIIHIQHTGCPNKHGNKETNSKSSLQRISVVLPNFNGQNKVTPARVYILCKR